MSPTIRIDRLGIDLGTASMAEPHAAAAAATGARLARVRFALEGRAEPDAAFLDAARRTVAALGAAGLDVLAVLDSDLTVAPEGMGAFDDRPPGPLALAWTDEMAANAALLAGSLGDAVAAWEILPAPNRGQHARIAPGRWAVLLAEIAAAVRGAVPGATIVAGGLHTDEADDGVDYLTAVYRAATDAGAWSAEAPPFDAIGLQLFVLADGGPSEDTVAAILGERTRRLWRVMERFEGTDCATERGIFVTGLAWDADRVGADVQARNIWTAFDALTSDPVVRLVVWTGLTDANPHAVGASGLYRGASIVPDDRRWAWNAFNDFVLYARQITPGPAVADLIVPVDGEALEEIQSPEEPEDLESPLDIEPMEVGAVVLAGIAVDALSDEEPEPEVPITPEPEAVPEPVEDDASLPDVLPVLAAPLLVAQPAGDIPPVAAIPVAAVHAAAFSAANGIETIVFRIPDAVEVLQGQGVEGARLESALEAIRIKYGGHEWLPPGEYHVAIRPAAAPTPAPSHTNQQIISALYRAGGGTWGLLERSGLKLSDLAARRTQPYEGPPIAALDALSDDEQLATLRELEAVAGGGGR